MKIKMIKVYRGPEATKLPGEIVDGSLAEKINEEHPTWCEKLKEKENKKGMIDNDSTE